MEVTVFVDGMPRVVCGLTDNTSCQEVVIALAQALGRPGRYTLKEKFKDFERCMSPSESLRESLKKYGEHVKEVKLILLLNNGPPFLWDPAPGGTTGLREPLGPLLRRQRPDLGCRAFKGSSPLASSAHRQSLPVLSHLRQKEEHEEPLEEVKRPKRKSLTLTDAWGWLGSLGRGRLHYCVNDQEGNKKTAKRSNVNLLEGPIGSGSVGSKEDSGQDGFLSRVRRRKRERQCGEHRTSCCIGDPNTREDDDQRRSSLGMKDGAQWTKDQTLGSKDRAPGRSSRADQLEVEKNKLLERITSQGARLRDLQLQITSVDHQVGELKGQQRARQTRQDAQRTAAEEEEQEQVLFWENELKAELGFERDIQAQFLEMRDQAGQCKADLEEYKRKLKCLDFTTGVKILNVAEEDPGILGKRVTEIFTGVETSDEAGSVNTGRKETPSLPHAPVPPNQIKERRLTGPTELREWWTRWSESQTTTAAPQTLVHRSELTIYLGSAKV
ncbi:unnamed protein product [Merluccius merluccius]